jgi:integrase
MLKLWRCFMGVFKRKRSDGTIAWYIDFYVNKKRYRELGGTTRTQAVRALEKVRSDILSGKFEFVTKVNDPQIDEFAKTYLGRRQHLRSRERDAASVKRILKHFSGKLLSAIGPQDIEDYISNRRQDGVSNGTINRELSCLKRMYALAVKWGDAKNNPAAEVDSLEEPPGRTRYLTEEEARRLIKCCSDHFKPIVITALNTGMRLGELLSLTWDRVHIDHAIDPYAELVETKNNKRRFVPLNDDMVGLLNALRAQNSGCEHVFLSVHGKPSQICKKTIRDSPETIWHTKL